MSLGDENNFKSPRDARPLFYISQQYCL